MFAYRPDRCVDAARVLHMHTRLFSIDSSAVSFVPAILVAKLGLCDSLGVWDFLKGRTQTVRVAKHDPSTLVSWVLVHTVTVCVSMTGEQQVFHDNKWRHILTLPVISLTLCVLLYLEAAQSGAAG